MAQRISNSFVNTNRPGAYFEQIVQSTPVGVASSGNIVIIGEASGGAAASSIDSSGDVLKNNFFTPDQLDRVRAKYISGPIVDAFAALAAPSSDANITGSANRIYIVKTNTSSKAEKEMASAYGTMKDKNFGADGNKYAFQISQSIDEVAAQVTSGVIPAFGVALDGLEFTIREQGGAESVITLGVGTHADRDELVTEIDGLLPAAMECVAGAAADTIIIRFAADASANTKGFGKSFELIDSTPGDLAAISLSAGLLVSAQEPEIQLDITRQDTGVNESFLVNADVAFNIGYEGTTATLDITDTTLTTTVSGGSGAALSINLSDYTTLSELANFINSQTGYSASVEATATQTNPVLLDNVSSLGICSTAADLEPGRVKKAAANYATRMTESAVLDFEENTLVGLPEVQGITFLEGGAKGSTLAADYVSAMIELESINVNFVLPLFSRDASEDISDGLTESGSTYTIDAIHASTKNHVLKMSTAKIKRHRQAFLSFWGSFSDAQSKSGQMANARISMSMQRSSQVDSQGVIQNYLPWHTAAIAVGMQAAGFYKSITNKFANVISFEDPSGFDSGSPGDIETAIDSGLLFLEQAVVGNKWVVDQTTYGIDTNFVYNSIQAMYTVDLISLDLAESMQTQFVGQSLADVDASTAISFIAAKFDAFKKQKLTAASDDAPLGFKNAKVSINGPIMEVSVEVKPATAILFIPITLEFSQVQNSASL